MGMVNILFLSMLSCTLVSCSQEPSKTVLRADDCWKVPKNLGEVRGVTRMFYLPGQSLFIQNKGCPKEVVFVEQNSSSLAILDKAFGYSSSHDSLGIVFYGEISGVLKRYGRDNNVKLQILHLRIRDDYPVKYLSMNKEE